MKPSVRKSATLGGWVATHLCDITVCPVRPHTVMSVRSKWEDALARVGITDVPEYAVEVAG